MKLRKLSVISLIALILVFTGCNASSSNNSSTSSTSSVVSATSSVVSEQQTNSDKSELSANISISCEKALSKVTSDDSDFPKDGIVLKKTEFSLEDGSSAYDLLLKALKDNGIESKIQSKEENPYNSVYVQSLGGVGEKEYGDMSGWICKVNGEFINVSCDEYKLKTDDYVEWLYSCDGGLDLGMKWE